jgi:hypothetical protein
METQIFHHANPKRKPYSKIIEKNQNPSRYYYNSVTNLKFQHKPKYRLSKNPHIKIDLLLLLHGPKSLKATIILYNESKHNILAFLVVGKANKVHK